MGWHSAEVKQKVEVVRLWCRIRNMPVDRTIHVLHTHSLNKSMSWEKNVLKLFNNIDISDDALIDKPRTNICIKKAKCNLQLLDIQKWHSALMRDGTLDTNGNKLRTYRLYKNDFKTEYYVKLNMSRDNVEFWPNLELVTFH